jgi:hypothetical protein
VWGRCGPAMGRDLLARPCPGMGDGALRGTADGPRRPRVHSDGLQRPYAGLPRGRHVVKRLGAGALAPERGDDDAGCQFYFTCADSKIHNSLKWQLS